MAPSLLEYVNAGAEDDCSLMANTRAFDQDCFQLRPRVLRRVSSVTTCTTILQGRALLHVPIMVAPFAGARAIHPDGERAVVRAAMQAGMGYTIPHYAGYSVNEILVDAAAAVATTTTTTSNNDNHPPLLPAAPVLFFQVYPHKPRKGHEHQEGIHRPHMEALIDYLTNIGCNDNDNNDQQGKICAMIITCDTVNNGNRARTYENDNWCQQLQHEIGGFPTPQALQHHANKNKDDGVFIDAKQQLLPGHSASMTWDDITWIVQTCRHKKKTNSNPLAVVLKGIMTAEDAQQAAQLGVDAIIVSNHGGRQLDGTLGTLQVLAECMHATRDTPCEVWIDGGIRRGRHVVQCLALGAKCVLVGRPFAWGLAAAGQLGVDRVCQILRHELITVMQLCGCAAISDIAADHVVGAATAATTRASPQNSLRQKPGWSSLSSGWMALLAPTIVAIAAFGLGRYSVSKK